MLRVRVTALITCLSLFPAVAADAIQAVGGEKCGGALNAYRVEFLAPEDAQVEARAKGIVGSGEEARPGTTSLSLDGKPCADGRCPFRAAKGQTYKLTAEVTGQKVNNLCISVTRP